MQDLNGWVEMSSIILSQIYAKFKGPSGGGHLLRGSSSVNLPLDLFPFLRYDGEKPARAYTGYQEVHHGEKEGPQHPGKDH